MKKSAIDMYTVSANLDPYYRTELNPDYPPSETQTELRVCISERPRARMGVVAYKTRNLRNLRAAK